MRFASLKCAPALAGLLVMSAATGSELGELSFEPCVLTAAGLPRPAEAQCTTILVPENPAEPEGRQIELALAWIPVEGAAEPDPVFFIAGGPGQSAREQYPAARAGLCGHSPHPPHPVARPARHRGLPSAVLPRRTGAGARPRGAVRRELGEYAARCRDALQEVADLRFYTTTEAVHDLELVRRRVGAAQVNLIGVSYGTRVAQQYAKAHPEHVRTIILDSVVPADLALGAEHARNLQDALDAQFARCSATPACLEAFGDPAARLERAMARLRAGGLEPVRYRDPTRGEWIEETPHHGHLSGVLRMYSYMPLTASLLPLIVHQADEGDYAALLGMMRMMTRDFVGQIASGMHNSVICTEDADEIALQEDARDTLLGDDFVDRPAGAVRAVAARHAPGRFSRTAHRGHPGVADFGGIRSRHAAALRGPRRGASRACAPRRAQGAGAQPVQHRLHADPGRPIHRGGERAGSRCLLPRAHRAAAAVFRPARLGTLTRSLHP
jgi:pimeloyl-ACP methyl ester carboxylesterase